MKTKINQTEQLDQPNSIHSLLVTAIGYLGRYEIKMKSYLLIITFLTLISCSTKSPQHDLKSVTHCLEAKDTDKDGLSDFI